MRPLAELVYRETSSQVTNQHFWLIPSIYLIASIVSGFAIPSWRASTSRSINHSAIQTRNYARRKKTDRDYKSAVSFHSRREHVMDLANYTEIELLRDGRHVEIRALRPKDREALIAAVRGMNSDSFYRRFFAVKHDFSEAEIDYFVDVDFVSHVALVAVVKEDSEPFIAGGGRYIVAAPGQGEVAFAVVDKYQGQGIGTILMRHLVAIARQAGLQEFIADVLPANRQMLKIFQKCGLPMTTRLEGGNVHVNLKL
jgi:GNAT superfamily N-acetyltransferase